MASKWQIELEKQEAMKEIEIAHEKLDRREKEMTIARVNAVSPFEKLKKLDRPSVKSGNGPP
jgi:hypothetical protein